MGRIPKIKVVKKNNAANVDSIRKKRKVKIVSSNNKKIVKPKVPSISQPRKHRIERKKSSNNIRQLRQDKSIIRLQNKVIKNENYYKLEKLKNIGKGRYLVMVACGPSVLEVDLKPLLTLGNIDMMTINKPLKSIWPTKFWAFCDHSQYLRNKQTFEHYDGILLNSAAVRARKNNQIIINVKHGVGVTRNIHEGYIIGRSSVHANLQVAMHMGYDKIFIFGVDMCAVNGKTHHYGVNPDVAAAKRVNRFPAEAKHFDRMASVLPPEIKSKIYFCSSYLKWPFAQHFNLLPHKEAIDKIIELSK
jgi:hypothetical protein